MKARVIATGKIISLDENSTVLDANPCNFNSYKISELEILHENTNFPKDYWEKLLHQYAGMAMQGMLSNEYTHKLYLDNKNYPISLLNDSITIAHALVEKMKEETKPKYEDEVNVKYYSTTKYLVRPNGYQFVDENGNVINTTKIVLKKKKKEYPKTYEECCEVIGISRHDVEIDLPQPYQQNMFNFFKLLICRDAYWKLYGEEMGLGKPWECDFNRKYYTPAIICREGYIQKVEVIYRNAILSFPTEEMRYAFYENFKEEIEKCKELL